VGILVGGFWAGAAYWLGIMSHPVQGWMVNAFGHAYGYRTFDTPDHSRNNTLVAWLVFGEGYQNNHHHAPTSPKFSVLPGEIDLGYLLCRGAVRLGMIERLASNCEWRPGMTPAEA